MRTAFLLVFMASTAIAADGFSTVPEFEADFDHAKPCKPLDGRKVWKGKTAFYIQALAFKTGQSGALSEDIASVVVKAEQQREALKMFEKACR